MNGTVLLATTRDAVARIAVGGERAVSSTALERSGAQCLALDPLRSGTVYVGCKGQGLWRSRDGGRSWDDCKLPSADVFSVAVSSADGAVYAGCEPSMLYVSRDGGESWRELESLRSIPSAPTWSFPPRPWTSHVRWIAPSPHDARLVLAGIELGGVMRTEDGGESWQDHRPGAKRDAHQLAWHREAPGRAYEAAGDGAAWSVDGGDTWRPADDGRDRHYVWALAVDELDPDVWYISAAPGPFQAHGREHAGGILYRSRGEGCWDAVAGPFDSMPYALAAGDAELWCGFRDGRLALSEDGGDTWRELGVEPALPRVTALVIAQA